MRTMSVRGIMYVLVLVVMCLLLSSCSELGCGKWGCNGEKLKISYVSPKSSTVAPGGVVHLHLMRELDDGEEAVPDSSVEWRVTSGGGSVNDDGVFTAPSSPGVSVVRAIVKGRTPTSSMRAVRWRRQRAPRRAPRRAASATPAEQKQFFYNGNDAGVDGGGTAPAFTLHDTCIDHQVNVDYHYTAHGKTPGTIALRGADGTTYGPWPCTGTPGQGGVVNAYWHAKPNITYGGEVHHHRLRPSQLLAERLVEGNRMAWVYGAEQ